MAVLKRRSWLVALVVISTLVACQRSDAPTEGGLPFPVREDSVFGPGSPLLDGFTVEEGSWLVGSPFAQRSEFDGAVSYGWRALLALTGDPQTVGRAYMAQADDRGFHARDELRCDRGRCEGEATKGSGKDPDHRFVVRAARSDDGLSGQTTSLVELDVFGAKKKPSVPPEEVAEDTPVSKSGRSPEIGERFGGIQFAVDGRRVGSKITFAVVRGSVLIAHPFLLSEVEDTLGPTMAAIFRVDGDLEKVAASYVRQAGEYYPDEPQKDEWKLGSVRVLEHSSYCAGGCGDYSSLGLRRPNGPAYLFIFASVRS